MPRPHEDLERHTPTDHRPGGVPIGFPAGAWVAIDVAHVRAERVGAGISAYETLIEKARKSSTKARAAVVLRSVNKRRVIPLIEIEGHEAFRISKSAWDDRSPEGGASRSCRIEFAGALPGCRERGRHVVHLASTDAYAFEHVARGPERVRALSIAIAAAQGFRGVLVFGSDDASASAVVYRFEHSSQVDAFRESAVAVQVLGPVGASGETISVVDPVKTFG